MLQDLISSEINYLHQHFDFWKHQVPPDATPQMIPKHASEAKGQLTRETTNLENNLIDKVLSVMAGTSLGVLNN